MFVIFMDPDVGTPFASLPTSTWIVEIGTVTPSSVVNSASVNRTLSKLGCTSSSPAALMASALGMTAPSVRPLAIVSLEPLSSLTVTSSMTIDSALMLSSATVACLMTRLSIVTSLFVPALVLVTLRSVISVWLSSPETLPASMLVAPPASRDANSASATGLPVGSKP